MGEVQVVRYQTFGRRKIGITQHAIMRWAQRVQGEADLDAVLVTARHLSVPPSYVRVSSFHRAQAVGFIELADKSGGFMVIRDAVLGPIAKTFIAANERRYVS